MDTLIMTQLWFHKFQARVIFLHTCAKNYEIPKHDLNTRGKSKNRRERFAETKFRYFNN